MSEAELHILKARMHEGRRAKASRAELVIGLPRGFVLRPSGEVALDPDEQVRATIRLVFDVFERRRSVYGVLRYLVDHDIQLPDRARAGRTKAGSGGTGRTKRRSATCCVIRPMLEPTFMVGVGWSAGASCPANHTADGGSSVCRSSGRCCAGIAGQPTSTGTPIRATRSRWRRTVPSMTASHAAARLCSAA